MLQNSRSNSQLFENFFNWKKKTIGNLLRRVELFKFVAWPADPKCGNNHYKNSVHSPLSRGRKSQRRWSATQFQLANKAIPWQGLGNFYSTDNWHDTPSIDIPDYNLQGNVLVAASADCWVSQHLIMFCFVLVSHGPWHNVRS